MNKLYKALPLIAGALLVLSLGAMAQSTTTTYTYTGTPQTFTVPAGVTSVDVVAQGGMGGNNAGVSMSDRPGYGGCISATLAVTPGAVLNVYVGQQGGNSTTLVGGTGGLSAGLPSGGRGELGYSPYAGGGGGGASDIRMGGTALTNRVIVAGGGGGAGGNWFLPAIDYDRGGDGGGTTGEDGWEGNISGAPAAGLGGTPSLGGGGGSLAGWGSGSSGLSGTGGNAGTPSGGGGGGGGYYGGGGGCWGGGGGGSNYASPTYASSVIHTRGCNTTGDGFVSITWTCVPPTGGAIVGPANFCSNGSGTYTNPTGTAGGTWTSSNTAVATIDPVTGVATGVSPGTTVLTYTVVLTCGSASATMIVAVDPAPAPITGGPDSVCMSSSTAINNVFFTDPTPSGTWTSADPTIATIDPMFGIASASSTSYGIVTISYTAGGCTVTHDLTVNPLPSPIVGSSQVCRFLTTTLSDPTPGGTWSSTVPAAASVDPLTGVVTGIGLGATNIEYTLPTGCSVSQFVSVSQPPLPITGPNQVCEGNAIVLTELVGGGAWNSSSPSNATVVSGVVTGLVAATVTISYTTPACPPVTHVVTVNPLPATITGSAAICVGYTTSLADATAGGAWSSSDPAVTVSSTGDVTSTTPGASSTIYYTLPTGCFVSTMVYVSNPPTLIISPKDSICQGDTVSMYNTTGGGIWSSTDLAIAQIIDSSGLITAVSAGTVNISYTLSNGCYAVRPFTVEPPLPGGVTISSSPGGIICEGTPVTFTATPTNGGTATYIWQKFSVALGGVDSTGVLVDTPMHGDAIMCFMMPHGVCALHDTVGDTLVLNIYPNNVSPSIVISTTGPDTIHYIGQVVTFFSVVTYGGTTQTFQWYQNGVAIPGATNSSYTTPVYASDTFWCVVNGNPPCSATPVPPGISNKIVIHDYLGVDPIATGSNELTLFPNPNTGSFTLSGRIAAVQSEVQYEVTNVIGQVISTGRAAVSNGEIRSVVRLGDIAPGSYLLRVLTGSGSETFHFVVGR